MLQRLRVSTEVASDRSLIQKRMRAEKERDAQIISDKERTPFLKLLENLTPWARLNCSLWRITYYLDFGSWVYHFHGPDAISCFLGWVGVRFQG